MNEYFRMLCISLLYVSFSIESFAQKLEVESFSVAATDISASKYVRKDGNGVDGGLVKVLLPMKNVKFEGNIILPVEQKTSEYWVYMTEGSKELKISIPGYAPILVNFRKWGVDGIVSRMTFLLALSEGGKPIGGVSESLSMQALLIDFEPKDAVVRINSAFFPTERGTLKATLPIGRYLCSVSAEGYKTYEKIISVDESNSTHLKVKLELLSNLESADNAYALAHQYLLANKDDLAEKYAKEAIKHGNNKGESILRALELRGFYDNK
jgi:hypothetical protein